MLDRLLLTAEVVGAVAAMGIALGAISRFRCVQWLWRQLVGKPLGSWFRREVAEATQSDFDRVHKRIDEHMNEEELQLSALVAALITVLHTQLGPAAAEAFNEAIRSESVFRAGH